MEDSQGEKTATQHKKQYDWLKQYQWQKGQSGNPEGGKKGKRLKTFVAEMFENMTDEDKAIFLKGLEPDLIWKMAEGNPKDESEIKHRVTISEVLDNLDNNGQEIIGQSMEIKPSIQDTQQNGAVDNVQNEQSPTALSSEQVV